MSSYNTAPIPQLLVSLARSPPTPFLTDGQEWNGVKFFQLSSHWQTHIKHFPVAVGTPLGYHSTD